MDQKTFSALLERYLSEDLSREEASRILDSLEDEGMRREWEEAVSGMLRNPHMQGLSDPARMEAIRDNILQRHRPAPSKTSTRLKSIFTYAAAAALLAAAVTGIIYFTRPAVPVADAGQPAFPAHEVKPGGNKAILTLADGSQITLDSAGNGAIASQGNVQVIKVGSGQLAYNQSGSGLPGGAVAYNTLATPRGGQFKILLPDGSAVWLNAASTLKFPTAFNGPEREVQLTGEAYFEIAKDPLKPFKVKVNDMAVKVLGTHFNVMAYPDESNISTTLLEGAVRIQHGRQELQLEPGQQAQLNNEGAVMVKKNVDVEEAVAWKNGYFHFERESLRGVMRQISRWYDADVTYEGDIPERQFGGKIARSSSVTDVLTILELSNVRYRIEGKKIIVMP